MGGRQVKLGQAGGVVGVSEGRLPEGHLSLLPFSDYGFHWDFATNDIEISVWTCFFTYVILNFFYTHNVVVIYHSQKYFLVMLGQWRNWEGSQKFLLMFSKIMNRDLLSMLRVVIYSTNYWWIERSTYILGLANAFT